MTKHLRVVKTSIVMGILIVSIFASFIPSTSAGILTTNLDVKMNYDAEAANKKVIPLLGEIIIPIEISIQIKGVFATRYEAFLQERTSASVDLSVGSTPSWASALVTPNIVSPQISATWGDPEEAYVHISFNENAPAHMPLKIVLNMHASVPGSLGLVKEVDKIAEISFTPSYLPIIDATPKTTFKEVSPGEIAEFVIDLKNLGNAETEFMFWTENVPNDWAATIPASKIVPSAIGGDDPTDTVILVVQPPYDFGYHNNKGQITLAIQGHYYAHGTNLTTPIYKHTFIIQNRGFSTPGFEIAFTIVALAGVAFFIRKRRKQ